MDPLVDDIKDLLAIPVNAWMASCLGVGQADNFWGCESRPAGQNQEEQSCETGLYQLTRHKISDRAN